VLIRLWCPAAAAAAAALQALRAFRLAGLIDHKGQWSGGDAVCVQVGLTVVVQQLRKGVDDDPAVQLHAGYAGLVERAGLWHPGKPRL
jgi:hypothetical protein